MLIRVRCHTCGDVIADKYQLYIKKVTQASASPENGGKIETLPYFDKTMVTKSIHGHVLDELNVTRMCCRMSMLTHIG